jgi:CRISPR-associated protein Cas1
MGSSSYKKPRQILLSKRANIFYLDRVRVMQKDERLVYLTESDDEFAQYFNIPERNTSILLLGKGSSITDAAVRRLADSNVIIGFCGTGGTPLFSTLEPAFLCPQSEYRPTEYMQQWAQKWFCEASRLSMARLLIIQRVEFCRRAWAKNKTFIQRGIEFPERAALTFLERAQSCKDSQSILIAEAVWAKALYALLARYFSIEFNREPGLAKKTTTANRVNSFLDHGNYMAYGLAAVALNGLGISFSFPLLHGKTRRGALVFDIADLIKDAIVMPCAFECGESAQDDKGFRSMLIEILHKTEALDFLFETTKAIAEAP